MKTNTYETLKDVANDNIGHTAVQTIFCYLGPTMLAL